MKIKDIIGGTKKRKQRGSRIKRLIGDSLHTPLREGGKIFPDAIPFDHGMIPVSYTHLTLPTKRIV